MPITAVTPVIVDANGGSRCVLTGSFVAGRAYRVYLGTDSAGLVCYSGVSGQGALCYPTSPTALPVVLPPTEPGDVPLFVVDTVEVTEQAATGLCRAEAPFLWATVFALRRDVRPTLDAGPTDPSQLPDAEPVPGFGP